MATDTSLTTDATTYGAQSMTAPLRRVLLRLGKPTRRGEEAALESWTALAGIPTIGRIEAPGTVEGGDTFWLRPDVFCIGRSLRTNGDGARQLADLVGG